MIHCWKLSFFQIAFAVFGASTRAMIVRMITGIA